MNYRFVHTGSLVAAAVTLALSCAKEATFEDDRLVTGEKPEALDTEAAGEVEIPLLYSYDFYLPDNGEDEAPAKTVFNDKKDRLKWEAGDRMGAYVKAGDKYSCNLASPINVEATPKTVTVNSSFAITSGAVIYAYYPYVADNTADGLNVRLRIPSAQHQSGDSFETDAMPMVSVPVTADGDWGKSTGRSLQLANLGSIICFNLYATSGSPKVTSLELTAGGESRLAGTFTYDLSSTELDTDGGGKELTVGPLTATEASASVATHLPEAAAVPTSKESGKKIYMVVAPGTLSSFTVTVFDSENGKKYSKTYSPEGGVSFGRNEIKTINLKMDSMTVTDYTPGIAGADDLIAARDAVNGGTSYARFLIDGKMTVTGNINMSGKTWSESMHYLEVDFVGAGPNDKVINNWTTSAPLFGTVAAGVTVSNLVIAHGSYTIDATTDAAWFAGANYGTIDDCDIAETSSMSCEVSQMTRTGTPRSVAAIAAVSSGTIQGCDNQGSINIRLTNNGAATSGSFHYDNGAYTYDGVQYIGGIAGLLLEGASLSDDTNDGAITLSSPGRIESPAVMGGIAGGTLLRAGAHWSNTPQASITGCTNRGKVRFHFEQVSTGSGTVYQPPFIGGVTGFLEGTLSGNSNRGAIQVKSFKAPANDDGVSSFLRGLFVGGVAGIATMGAYGCENHGDITQSGTLATGIEFGTTAPCIGGIAGYAGKDGSRSLESCTNTGAISSVLHMRGQGRSDGFIGGIAGLSNSNILSSSNSGPITVNSRFYSLLVGGVAGWLNCASDLTSATVSGNANSGDINVHLGSAADTAAVTNQSKRIGIGGIIGRVSNKPVAYTSSSNTGTITVDGGLVQTDPLTDSELTDSRVRGLAVGGLVAWGADKIQVSGTTVSNSGNITLTNPAAYEILVGGCIGQRTTVGQNNLCNTGDIEISGTVSSYRNLYAGGIIGFGNGGATMSGLNNEGDITIISSGNADTTFVGGLAGRLETFTGTALNNISSSSSSGAVSCNRTGGEAYISGGVGCLKGNLNTVTNSGSVMLRGSAAQAKVGGLCGRWINWSRNQGVIRKNESQTLTFGSCTNAAGAAVTVTAATAQAGGLVGEALTYFYGDSGLAGVNCGQMEISSCHNYGTLTVSTSTGTACAGGIAGVLDGLVSVKNTDCTIADSPSIDVDSAADAYVGGIAGKMPEKVRRYGSDTDIAYFGNTDFDKTTGLNNGSSLIRAEADGSIYAGGLAGYGEYGVLHDSGNSCALDITTEGNYTLVGGILGRAQDRKTNTIRLHNCTNAGDISATHGKSGADDNKCRIGGLVGDMNGQWNSSRNSGDISVTSAAGENFIGGVGGMNGAYTNGSSSTGSIRFRYTGVLNNPTIYAALGIGWNSGGTKTLYGEYKGSISLSGENAAGSDYCRLGVLAGLSTGGLVAGGTESGQDLIIHSGISLNGITPSATPEHTYYYMNEALMRGKESPGSYTANSAHILYIQDTFSGNDGTEVIGSDGEVNL